MRLNLLTTVCGLLFLTFSLHSCQQEESLNPKNTVDQFAIEFRSDDPCGDPFVTPLRRTSGPNTGLVVGSVTTQNDDETLCVIVNTNAGVTISEIHLYVGECNAIPTTGGPNPNYQHGSFNFNTGPFTATNSYTVTIDRDDIPYEDLDCFCIAFRGTLSGGTSYADGTHQPSAGSNNRAFDYCLQECECVIPVGDYFTYSHGFYGNNNGAAFFLAHPELGPVTVGCGANTTAYTLAAINALMQGGNSAPPGILVKQIITMMLNVGASGFLASEQDLGCLVVVADGDPLTTLDDLFEGMTVDEVIAAANDYVGGCDTTTFSAEQLTAILEAMVNNFHLGNVNLGLLTCCEE